MGRSRTDCRKPAVKTCPVLGTGGCSGSCRFGFSLFFASFFSLLFPNPVYERSSRQSCRLVALRVAACRLLWLPVMRLRGFTLGLLRVACRASHDVCLNRLFPWADSQNPKNGCLKKRPQAVRASLWMGFSVCVQTALCSIPLCWIGCGGHERASH